MLREEGYAGYLALRDRYFENSANNYPNFWEKLKTCFWCTFQRLPYLAPKQRATFWWLFGGFIAGMTIYIVSALMLGGLTIWIGLSALALIMPGYFWSGLAKSSRPGYENTFRTIFWAGIALRWLLTPATATKDIGLSIGSAILFALFSAVMWFIFTHPSLDREYQKCETEKES